ncbi:unnamed protein product, partial [Ilex paraguariensis]
MLERGNHSGKDDIVKPIPTSLDNNKEVEIKDQNTIVDSHIHEELQSKSNPLESVNPVPDKINNPLQILYDSNSTFLVDHLYVCLKGVGVSLDDERGLRFVKEPPNKGFKSDDDLFASVDWEHSDSKSSDAE